ncbi:MAG: 4-hydroxybenzoate octaprenyltransferase [Gammaproteobacteria bacterium]|nr:4-hydroxybenzoate octaprenyltransferase [Rhodocyclaceae bacterium]MBU3910618.1 4-hydroxybenzoate octaprenyltransferase [Gammaproteobacteria bacterium]MBU3988311.1 4-hydroxybenzoate octaprenyltransferase [Gammaproteobacteria bacterium]MBU4005099.1 4-hydroxybenzoate octaprenyltransferase [Gammaproteobacteria bacterium]MBU4020692.1 4-hydroxybenzoate octaprenyltransferase [Gammaproteobacteria bacterium]
MPSFAHLKERLDRYEKLMRLDKPIGILLLLWPTLWAVWIAADGKPHWMVVWIFILGTVLMRSAGCVINDYADRDFDPHVERTKARPLAAGTVTSREAFILCGFLVVCAFLLILPLLTPLLFGLAVAAVFLAASYPFTKRFFALPQAYLGVAFGFGIPMAFAAILGRIPEIAWWLLAANIFWALAYDTEYALVDRDDDIRIGIRTSALTFGRFDIAAIMLCYGATLVLLAWVGWQLGFGWPYALGLAAAAAIAGYHYTLIRERDRMRCFKAFLHNNWFGAAVFAGIALDYLLRSLKA